MSDITHYRESILKASEQYIVVIVNCKSKKINPKAEPLYAKIINEHSSKANVYSGENTVIDRRPSQIKILTISTSARKPDVIAIYGQYYEGKKDLPNDNKRKRLMWFEEALDEIAEIKGLRSIAFPSQIAKDGGGNWIQYYQAIKDFTKTIHLKNENIKVSIYENPTVDEDVTEKEHNKAPNKISLVNCINLTEVVDLSNIKMNTKKIKLNIEKPTLLTRDSLVNSVNKTRIKQLQKEKTSEQLLDLISSGSSSGGEPNKKNIKGEGKGEGEGISSDDYETPSAPPPPKQSLNLTTDSDDDEPSEKDAKSKIQIKPKINIKSQPKPKISLKKSPSPSPEPPVRSLPSVVPSPPKRVYPETDKNPDWNTTSLSQLAQNGLGGWSREIFSLPDIKEILGDIDQELSEELNQYGNTTRFLPDFENIFAAFKLCSWENTRVVILGQDPYFANTNEAMGLSFSVPEGVKVPPSLRNIFKEIKNTYDDYEIPKSGDLTGWARQGVLLLNSALTVRHKKAGSHMRIWKTLTDKIIELIAKKKTTPVVFMLWGGHAKGKAKLIKSPKHIVLKATHPSPLGANQGGWFHCGHFGESNIQLMESGQDPIDWGE